MVDDNKSPCSRMSHNPWLTAHCAAVVNTLAWAEESAARGDYVDALGWLNVLDAIRETLPEAYESKRLDWRRALVEQSMPQCNG